MDISEISLVSMAVMTGFAFIMWTGACIIDNCYRRPPAATQPANTIVAWQQVFLPLNMNTTEITLVSLASFSGCIILVMFYYAKDYCDCRREIEPVETIVVCKHQTLDLKELII